MYVGLKQPRGDGERYVTPARAAAKETSYGQNWANNLRREGALANRLQGLTQPAVIAWFHIVRD